jgi:hypothetical protein
MLTLFNIYTFEEASNEEAYSSYYLPHTLIMSAAPPETPVLHCS